jgi:hypothetical protein
MGRPPDPPLTLIDNIVLKEITGKVINYLHKERDIPKGSRVNHFRRRFHGKESSPLEAIRELG